MIRASLVWIAFLAVNCCDAFSRVVPPDKVPIKHYEIVGDATPAALAGPHPSFVPFNGIVDTCVVDEATGLCTLHNVAAVIPARHFDDEVGDGGRAARDLVAECPTGECPAGSSCCCTHYDDGWECAAEDQQWECLSPLLWDCCGCTDYCYVCSKLANYTCTSFNGDMGCAVSGWDYSTGNCSPEASCRMIDQNNNTHWLTTPQDDNQPQCFDSDQYDCCGGSIIEDTSVMAACDIYSGLTCSFDIFSGYPTCRFVSGGDSPCPYGGCGAGGECCCGMDGCAASDGRYTCLDESKQCCGCGSAYCYICSDYKQCLIVNETQSCFSWHCDLSSYNSKDGCDCGCGILDPDCLSSDYVKNCAAGQMCNSFGYCYYPTVPDTWTCSPDKYNANDGCDCECGEYDPDCSIDQQPGTVTNCDSNSICSKSAECIPWHCDGNAYGTLDGCHCDCGSPDPDCDTQKVTLNCDSRHHCESGSCRYDDSFVIGISIGSVLIFIFVVAVSACIGVCFVSHRRRKNRAEAERLIPHADIAGMNYTPAAPAIPAVDVYSPPNYPPVGYTSGYETVALVASEPPPYTEVDPNTTGQSS